MRQAGKVKLIDKNFAGGLIYFYVITTNSFSQSKKLSWINHDQFSFFFKLSLGQVKLHYFYGQSVELVQIVINNWSDFKNVTRWFILVESLIRRMCVGHLDEKRQSSRVLPEDIFWKAMSILGKKKQRKYASCLIFDFRSFDVLHLVLF